MGRTRIIALAATALCFPLLLYADSSVLPKPGQKGKADPAPAAARLPCRDPLPYPEGPFQLPAEFVADAEPDVILRMARDHFERGTDAMRRLHWKAAIKEFKKSYLLQRHPQVLEELAEVYGLCLEDRENGIYYAKKYLAFAPEGRYRADAERLIEQLAAPPK